MADTTEDLHDRTCVKREIPKAKPIEKFSKIISIYTRSLQQIFPPFLFVASEIGWIEQKSNKQSSHKKCLTECDGRRRGKWELARRTRTRAIRLPHTVLSCTKICSSKWNICFYLTPSNQVQFASSLLVTGVHTQEYTYGKGEGEGERRGRGRGGGKANTLDRGTSQYIEE